MRRFFRHLDARQIELGLYAIMIIVMSAGLCMVLWYSGGVWLKLWYLVCAVVEPLAYGCMMGYVLNPLVTRISHLLKRNPRLADQGFKRRTIAVAITACIIVVFFLGLLAIFAVLLAHGISTLDWQSMESVIEVATSDISGFIKSIEERLVSFGLLSKEAETTLVSAFVNVRNVASTVLFSAVFTVYNLIDGDRLFAYAQRVAHNVLGEHGARAALLLDDADRVFSGYFRGQATDALVVGVLTAIALSLAGVPHAPVIGLLAGLGNLIPYVGGPVAFASIALACFVEEAWMTMAVGFAVMALVMFVDGNIINPKLLSDNVEVHPILVVAALIAGGTVGGIAGMLVAVPTAAWLKIQLDRWMDTNEKAKGSLVDDLRGRLGGDE